MGTATIVLDGQLTLEKLVAALGGVSPAAAALIVDCSTMTGYTREARTRFVEWNREHRERISRVGIVTKNTLWHMIIAAMALASKQEMKAFPTVDAAAQWAESRRR